MKYLISILLPLAIFFTSIFSFAATEESRKCADFKKRLDDIKEPRGKEQFAIKQKHFAEGLKIANEILDLTSINNKKWTPDFLDKERTLKEIGEYAFGRSNCEMGRFAVLKALIFTAQESKDSKMREDSIAIFIKSVNQAPPSLISNSTDASLLVTAAESNLIKINLEEAKTLKAKYRVASKAISEEHHNLRLSSGWETWEDFEKDVKKNTSPKEYQRLLKREADLIKAQRTELVALLPSK